MSTIERCDAMNVYFFSKSFFVRLHRIASAYEPLFLLFFPLLLSLRGT